MWYAFVGAWTGVSCSEEASQNPFYNGSLTHAGAECVNLGMVVGSDPAVYIEQAQAQITQGIQLAQGGAAADGDTLSVVVHQVGIR
jgi:hypothetical protein